MVFLGICFIANKSKTWQISLAAITFSFAIEFSQLYQAPWINNLRHTKLGGLVLGYGFLTSDLICYTVGIAIGIILDLLIKRKIEDNS